MLCEKHNNNWLICLKFFPYFYVLHSNVPRLNDQTEVAEQNIKKLKRRTESRLSELSDLEVSAKQSEDDHFLHMVEKLRDAWPTVADDDSTLKQLEELQKKVTSLTTISLICDWLLNYRA